MLTYRPMQQFGGGELWKDRWEMYDRNLSDWPNSDLQKKLRDKFINNKGIKSFNF